jgi:opacity protein-like surface antigen
MQGLFRGLLAAFAAGLVVAPSQAIAQTSVSGGVAGAIYRPSDSFEVPGPGAALGEAGDIEHETRPGLDAALGARLSPMLRGGVAFAWRPRGEMTASIGPLRNTSEIGSYALFFDGTIDVPQWRAGRVTPFFTAGGGLTHNTYHDNGTGVPGGPTVLVTGDNANTYFAWRAGAGVAVELAPSWALDIGWRYADYASVSTANHFVSQIPGIEFDVPLPQAPSFTLAANEFAVSLRRDFGVPRSGAPLGNAAADARGFYLRFETGGVAANDPGLVIDQLDFPLIVDFNRAYHLGAGAGYRLNPHWRADVTVAGLPALRQFSFQQGQPIGAADLSSVAVMFSGYYDIAQMGALTPFVGAGVGPAWNRYGDLTITAQEGSPGASIPGRTTAHFAYQVGGGVSTYLGSGWSLDVGFQHFDRGEYTNQPIAFLTNGQTRTDLQSTGRLATNEVHIGMRRRF